MTGSNGFLGQYIKKNLDNEGLVITLNKSKSDYNVNLVSDIPKFAESFDLVIHCAGIAHQKESKNLFDENCNITINLLRGFTKKLLPNRFVFISSISVYGLESGELIDENQPLLAKDPYGLSKIQSEKLITKWCEENNIVCTIIRLPLVVGYNPPGNLGKMIHGIRKGYYFNISGGNAKKSMVLAEDVAKIILQASFIGGIYNLTDGYHPNFNELSKSIGKIFNRKYIPNIPYSFALLLARIGDKFPNYFPINSKTLIKIISNLTFDDSLARKNIGWKSNLVIHYVFKNR